MIAGGGVARHRIRHDKSSSSLATTSTSQSHPETVHAPGNKKGSTREANNKNTTTNILKKSKKKSPDAGKGSLVTTEEQPIDSGLILGNSGELLAGESVTLIDGEESIDEDDVGMKAPKVDPLSKKKPMEDVGPIQFTNAKMDSLGLDNLTSGAKATINLHKTIQKNFEVITAFYFSITLIQQIFTILQIAILFRWQWVTSKEK